MTLAVWWGLVNFIFGLLGCWVAWQIFVIRVKIRDINHKINKIVQQDSPAADTTSLQSALNNLGSLVGEQRKGERK